jgi:hypothetical protein
VIETPAAPGTEQTAPTELTVRPTGVQRLFRQTTRPALAELCAISFAAAAAQAVFGTKLAVTFEAGAMVRVAATIVPSGFRVATTTPPLITDTSISLTFELRSKTSLIRICESTLIA